MYEELKIQLVDIQQWEQKERNSQSCSIISFGKDTGTDKATVMQINSDHPSPQCIYRSGPSSARWKLWRRSRAHLSWRAAGPGWGRAGGGRRHPAQSPAAAAECDGSPGAFGREPQTAAPWQPGQPEKNTEKSGKRSQAQQNLRAAALLLTCSSQGGSALPELQRGLGLVSVYVQFTHKALGFGLNHINNYNLIYLC